MKPETVSHYRLIRSLGAGGMGEVVEAHDTVLGRTVALKFLSPALAADPEARGRFLREARAAASLTHPNIAVIYETGEAGGRVFIAMECVRGETLAARMSRAPVSVTEASTWGAAVADALAEAHARGLVHRDMKPANVMLTPDGRIKVLDFGLAKRAAGAAASPDAATEALLTEPHTLLGTPAYMAPEIWKGIEADPRSDVFALGVMLYEMLAGRRPFTGGSSHAVMAAILTETPPSVGEAAPGIPPALARVVDRALARDPGDRYPSAAELRDDLQRSIEAPDSLAAAPAAPSHLPALASAFVGRARELGEIRALLAASRMVTLLGPGGAGKSRLAVEAVRRPPPDLEADAIWVDLAPVRGDGLVAATAAAVLDARPGPGETVEDALAAALASRRAVLVLDNCEHLLEGCAKLVHRLLSSAPGLRVLATSRERLRVEGERVYPVPSLDLPPGPRSPEFTLEATTASDAVRLFAERAGAAQPGFRVTADNAAAVAAICRLLDGIPLALELAATRVPALGPEGLRRGLEHRFRLLTGGSRTAPERHRTLRAAMDWSYEHLAPEERILLARLSVFAGGADLDAAEAVCAGNGVDPEDVPLLLVRLHDKSMLFPVPEPGGRVRHRLLETVREYAAERLDASGETDSMGERHASWFLTEAEKTAPELTGPGQLERMDRLERDRDNLRRALARFAESGDAGRGLRMGAALWRWWSVRGRTDEGRAWFDRLLALPASDDQLPERARALRGAGALADDRSDFEAARALPRGEPDPFAATGGRSRARRPRSASWGSWPPRPATTPRREAAWRRAWPDSSGWGTHAARPPPSITWGTRPRTKETTPARGRSWKRAWSGSGGSATGRWWRRRWEASAGSRSIREISTRRGLSWRKAWPRAGSWEPARGRRGRPSTED